MKYQEMLQTEESISFVKEFFAKELSKRDTGKTLYILDEPTTGLDPNQLEDIRALIRNLGKHKTVMLSTHIMQEVEAMCSRVVIISKGNVVANAPVNELTASDQKLEQVFKELTTK